ncbi:MAG TPA: polymer-forming cytoskeletal protein [Deinococcales bacterium]|nr:polymer-forming cytoskeletal protein [Deinococcales bacterium]
MTELELDERLHDRLDTGGPNALTPEERAAAAPLLAATAALQGLSRPRAPEGQAAALAARIHQDALETRAVRDALRATAPSAPRGLAAAIARDIALDARLHGALPPVTAPAGFATGVAARIHRDARPEFVPVEPAPGSLWAGPTGLYFLVATLAAAGLGAIAWAWPYAASAASAVGRVVQGLPSGALWLYVALLVLAGLAGTRRVRLPAGALVGAFAVSLAVVAPSLLPVFGSGRVPATANVGTVVRLGGDLNISGHVHGDAVSIGGSVRLEPGAQVDGSVVTLLGDVYAAQGASLRGGQVSAVLGSYHAESQVGIVARSADLPGLGAATAFKPLRDLLETRYWPLLYLGLIAAAAALLASLPGALTPALARFREPGAASLGLGFALLLLAVPLVLVTGLTLVGMPFSLLLAIVALGLFTFGLALVDLEAGTVASRWLGLTGRLGGANLVAARIALGLLIPAALLLVPAVAAAVWFLLGAWGAGAIARTIASGSITPDALRVTLPD